MHYGQRLSLSLRQFWNNRSLLSVMLLQFIAVVLLAIFFIVINNVLVLVLNNGLQPQPSTIPVISTASKVIVTILTIIEFFAMIYVCSFFMSGFYGMIKNVIQDGSTSFNEFIPSTKRYWRAVFRFSIIPGIILVVAGLPFLFYSWFYTYIVSTGAQPEIVAPQLQTVLLMTFLVLAFVMLILLFLLGFAPAIIAFEDEEAWPAAKDAMKLAKRNFGMTFLAAITSLAILFISFFIGGTISSLFILSAQSIKSEVWSIIANILDFLLYAIVIAGGIIATLFFFNTYSNITLKSEARKTETHAHVRTTKIKRK